MKTLLPLLGLLVSTSSDAGPTLSPADASRMVRSATRLLTSGPGAPTFMIVTEASSGRFVQFTAPRQVLTFDFPVLGASQPGIEHPTHDGECSASAPLRRADEVEERYLPVEEEERLKALLIKAGHPWQARYCLRQSRDGQRVGYNLSLVGRLGAPKAVVPFVQNVFNEVYRLPAMRTIDIETDE